MPQSGKVLGQSGRPGQGAGQRSSRYGQRCGGLQDRTMRLSRSAGSRCLPSCQRLSRSAGSRCLPSCQALTSLGQIRMRATGLSARCFFFGRAIPIRMAQDNCGRPSSVATARASGTLFAGKHRFFRPRVRRRCHIALIAILALAFHHSVGPCGANVSSCEASVCPAHQHGGCHQHSKNPGPQTSHECFVSATYLNAADKPDSEAG